MFLKKLNNEAIILCLCFFQMTITLGQSRQIMTIDTALLPHAHVVIHRYETEIDILDESTAVVTDDITLTVLSEQFHRQRDYTEFSYDDHTAIKLLSIELYDSRGELTKKVRKSDFDDEAYFDGYSIHTDGRELSYHVHEMNVPYTMVIKSKVEYKQLMSAPGWYPILDERIALDEGRLTLKHPKGMKINYRGQHISDPIIVESSESIKYVWELNSFKALHHLSSLDASPITLLPIVRWAPETFYFGGITGGFDSWKNYGKWLYELGNESRPLPPEARDEINKLVTSEMTELEKIKVVYSYLQERSRYVSIQLGIGGWQPMTAAEVHVNQYGDCKALSNYTQALLTEVGVNSFYALINAGNSGDDFLNINFPSSSFNHAVLLVPIANDTLLLECTSQTTACGFRSRFTDNRYALAISENGGRLVKTKAYNLQENIEVDSVIIDIRPDGVSDLKSHSILSGIFADRFDLMKKTEKEKKIWLSDYIHFAQFDIVDYSMKIKEDNLLDYTFELNTTLTSKNFVVQSGSRLFLPPAVFHEFGNRELPDTMQHHLQFKRPFQYRTIIQYSIPEQFTIENSLEDVTLEASFGRYEISYNWDKNSNVVTVTRHYLIKAGVYSKAEYVKYRKFKKKIYKIEKRDIVLIAK